MADDTIAPNDSQPSASHYRERSTAPAANTRFVGLYSFILMALYNLAVAGLIAVPVQFILKDNLKLSPTQLSTFGLLTDVPLFFGFIYGFIRDRWRPMGKGDRGYFFAVPILLAAVYAWMAFSQMGYQQLLVGMLILSVLNGMLGAAAQGLLASIAKDFGMMGRLSAIALITVRASWIWSTTVSGDIGEASTKAHHPEIPFLLSGLVCLTVLVMAFWRPKSIFRSGDEVFVSVIPEGAMDSIKRLFRHKAVYLPALVLFLFEFAPGWGTALLYFLTNNVHLDEAQYGVSQGWLRLGQVAGAVLYPFLCTRFRFKPLLYVGTVLAVIGGPAFLLIHGAGQANIVSLLAGLSCGIALASYYDLLVRCCPKELEGVAFMLTYSMITIAGDTSDLFGSWLMERGGFALALWISTAFTALIFIPILFLPRQIAETQEGERMVDPDPPEPELQTA